MYECNVGTRIEKIIIQFKILRLPQTLIPSKNYNLLSANMILLKIGARFLGDGILRHRQVQLNAYVIYTTTENEMENLIWILYILLITEILLI